MWDRIHKSGFATYQQRTAPTPCVINFIIYIIARYYTYLLYTSHLPPEKGKIHTSENTAYQLTIHDESTVELLD